MTSLNHHAPARATFALVGALAGALGLVAVSGCDDTSSATDLHLDGPPMIEQVRLNDVTVDTAGILHTKRVFGFGTHPDATTDDTPAPATLLVASTSQQMRIIIDHLLLGNFLENISCTTAIDDTGSHFGFVPVGATPDDIAKCAVAPDLLPQTCVGDFAVCICNRDAGCPSNPALGTVITFPKGQSVGVLDGNLDGAADLHQFRKDAVAIKCGTGLTINVPIDLDNSYWNPSGDQQVPAVGGFDALGPAIMLKPAAPLPADVKCQLVFSSEVVDRPGVNVCAPANGDITQGCTPGDTSAFTFQMEPLNVSLSNPTPGGTLNRTDDIIVTSSDNIPLDPASIGNIKLLAGATPYTQVTITLDTSGSNVTIHSTATGGFDANTTYTLTVPTTVTDTYGQPVVQALTATFTTGA